jgi:hypothetical protein
MEKIEKEAMHQEKADSSGKTLSFREKNARLDCIRNEQ